MPLMSVAIDPQTILDRVAFRLSLPAFASGQFVTADDALTMLQDACERLSGILLSAYTAKFFAQSATVATQANLDLVSLPDGIARVEAVYWLTSSGNEVQLAPATGLDDDLTPRAWEWDESAYYAWTLRRRPTYRLEGNTLVLRPVPSEVYSLRIDYQNTPTITALSDTIYGQAGWAEWLVLDCCEQIADREDKNPGRFTARKMVIEAQIRDQAAQRDKGKRVAPVDAWDQQRSARRTWRDRL